MRTAALLTLLFGLFAAAPAAAQCPEFFTDTSADGRVTPSSSNSLVPTNTLVWYLVVNPDTSIEDTSAGLMLQSITGSEIGLEPLGTVRAADRTLFVYRPDEELEPLTDYEIEFDQEPGSATLISRVGFRTSDGRDTDGPAIPTVLRQELFTDFNKFSSQLCGVTDYSDEISFLLGTEGYFNLMAHEADVDAVDDLFADVITIAETAEVSWVDDIGPNQQFAFRFSTVDLAGNFSGWSEPTDVTTPGPGCVSTDGQAARASLLLAALMLLIGRYRRRRLGQSAVFGLMLALMLPTAALADSPPLITGEPEAVQEEAPPPPPQVDWKETFGAELELHTRGWAIASAGTGLLEASFLLMQPARVPFALQLSVANTLLWMPTLSTMILMVGTQAVLKTTHDADRFETALLRAGTVFGVASLAMLSVSIPGMIYGGSFDPAIGVGILGAQLSLVFVAVACRTLSRRVTVHSWEALRREAKVQVMPTPTGIVVLF